MGGVMEVVSWKDSSGGIHKTQAAAERAQDAIDIKAACKGLFGESVSANYSGADIASVLCDLDTPNILALAETLVNYHSRGRREVRDVY